MVRNIEWTKFPKFANSWNFEHFPNLKKNLIPKVSNLENSQNFYGKLVIFQIARIDGIIK